MRFRLAAGVSLLAALLVAPPAAPLSAPPAMITPASREVSLRAGQSAWFPYVVRLAPDPRPLDVLFLVDTSPWAAAATFDAVRDGLGDVARRLAGGGRDVRMGVAEFRDVGDVDSEGQATYRMRRRLAAPGPGLFDAIAALRTSGVDHPLGVATTIALDQAVHGDGHLTVPPGQAAGFTRDRDAVIVLVTDSPVAQRRGVDPSIESLRWDPEFTEVAVVGLVPWTAPAPVKVVGQLDRLAWFGAARAVECDDEPGLDSELDVRPQSTLRCAPWLEGGDPRADRDRFAAVSRAAIEAVGRWWATGSTLPKGLGTDEDADGRPLYPVVTTGGGWADPTRLLRSPYQVRLRCPNDSRGKTFSIGLDAYRQGVNYQGLAKVRLRCR